MVGAPNDMSELSFSVVVAMHQPSRGIGRDNDLPWPRLPRDMAFFRTLTTTTTTDRVNAVIMGRKTWESLPATKRPLPGRINVVLTSAAACRDGNGNGNGNVLFSPSLPAALAELETRPEIDRIFVIGGERVFAEALAMPNCQSLYVTEIRGALSAPCDVFFPEIPADQFQLIERQPENEANNGGDNLRVAALCRYERRC